MDINSVITVCSLCAMLVVTGYSAKIWYRYLHRQFHPQQ